MSKPGSLVHGSRKPGLNNIERQQDKDTRGFKWRNESVAEQSTDIHNQEMDTE